MKPLIGLVGRRKKGHQIAGTSENLHGIDIDIYMSDYGRAVREAGGLPILLPVDIDPSEYIDRLEGLVLTGGTDVGPSATGVWRKPICFRPKRT